MLIVLEMLKLDRPFLNGRVEVAQRKVSSIQELCVRKGRSVTVDIKTEGTTLDEPAILVKRKRL